MRLKSLMRRMALDWTVMATESGFGSNTPDVGAVYHGIVTYSIWYNFVLGRPMFCKIDWIGNFMKEIK